MSQRPSALEASEVAARAAEVPDWDCSTDRLSRTIECGSFVRAFGLMSSIALVAERMNHHPEWSNVYGTVRVDLTTHDAGGVTDLDFTLASRIDELL